MAKSDVSAVTNLIPTVNEGFITTVAAPGATSGGTTIPFTSVSGLVNGSVFVGIVEPGLTNQQAFTGIVDTGGSQITSVKWTRGTNAAHAAGVTVVDYVDGTKINMLAKAMATHANQDGTLKAGAVTATATLADGIVTAIKLASDSVTTVKILDSSVTDAKLSTTAGNINSAWTSYTPTITGSVGNGTVVGAYKQIGKTVYFRVNFTLGGTSTLTGGTVSLPVTASTAVGVNDMPIGQGFYIDAGNNNYAGIVSTSGTTTAIARIFVSGTSGRADSVNSSNPFVWGTADIFSVSGTYEAA